MMYQDSVSVNGQYPSTNWVILLRLLVMVSEFLWLVTKVNSRFQSQLLVFTARCYASAVLAMALCPSVSLSVTSRSSTKTAKRRIT